jgi:hypothetical protein
VSRAVRLRQIALVARRLEPAVEELCGVLGIDVGYRDPGVGVFGLENAVMPVGDTFLEVVSPVKADTTAGRLLERRRGDGGYMVILQTDDLARERARIAQLGVRVVWEAKLSDAAAIHLHPRDVGGAIVSFDWMDPPESWKWAGPQWKSHVRGDRSAALVGAELQSADPARMAARWSQVLGAPATQGRGGVHEIALDGSWIRFVPERDDRGEGVSGVDLRAADSAAILQAARERGLAEADGAIVLGGTRFRLV